MKQLLAIVCLSLLALGTLAAQSAKPYQVVFDLTSRDSLDQKAVIRWIHEITDANPKAELEVVMYGKGFELVMPERSAVLSSVKEAMKLPNVSFKVCEIAMKNNKIEQSQLLPEAQTVPDGIYEIISKQRDQWGYIKVSH